MSRQGRHSLFVPKQVLWCSSTVLLGGPISLVCAGVMEGVCLQGCLGGWFVSSDIWMLESMVSQSNFALYCRLLYFCFICSWRDLFAFLSLLGVQFTSCSICFNLMIPDCTYWLFYNVHVIEVIFFLHVSRLKTSDNIKHIWPGTAPAK